MTKNFAVHTPDGKAIQTPARHPLEVPTKALADAIAAEWKTNTKYNPHKMPLTSLAFTAIDRIADQKEAIVEVLLAYVDTDTLSYRATGSEKLAKQQDELWGPILGWAKKVYGVTWEVTSGVMPIDQSGDLHKAVSKRLMSLTPMQLAACSMLASGFSSLVLMLAVLEKHINAEKAFTLSRLEEESQAEAWGRDEEADQRAARLQAEILATAQFLGLLEGV